MIVRNYPDKKLSRIKISTVITLTIGLAFILASLIIIVHVNIEMRKQALNEAEAKALILLNRNMATHHYFSVDLKPRLFKLTEPVRPEGYFDPAWMSSTYAVRDIDKFFKSISSNNYYYKEAAINARFPENEADEFERVFIKKLNRNPELIKHSTVRNIKGRPFFVVLRRGEVMEESCLRCHSTPDKAPKDMVRYYGPERSFGRSMGEVVSAVSIRIPLEAAYAEANRYSLQLSFFMLTILLSLFLIQLFITRKMLLTPLSLIRNKALQIANEDGHLGEKIPEPFGRELNELTSAFNSMSESLGMQKNHLEKLVDERTDNLTKANEQLQKEIEERATTENKLQESLSEKELLLKEIHHRVKNNMHVISSILDLQAAYAKDKKISEVFAQCQNRIISMALVHEKLYRTKNLSEINFKDYLQTFSENLFDSYEKPSANITLKIDVQDIYLDLDTAIPLTLIINELVSNAMKHAFHGKKEGKITISLQRTDEEHFCLKVSDNGTGIPEGLDIGNTDSLGLQLVTLLTRQLKGELVLSRKKGTEFQITFKRKI